MAMKQAVTIILLAGFMGGGSWLYQYYDGDMGDVWVESDYWPAVSGLVLKSDLVERPRRTGSQPKTEYDVDVVFEYVVDGELYRNDVVRFDQAKLSSRDKELLVSSHPVGKKVEVYYNPEKPKQSVLVRESYR